MGLLYTAAENNAPALSPMSSSNSPTWGSSELEIVMTSCSLSHPLSNELEFPVIKMSAVHFGSDVGRIPQPTLDKHNYRNFVHGRRNAPALSPMTPLTHQHLVHRAGHCGIL